MTENAEKAVTPTYHVSPLDTVIAQHVAVALTLYNWNMTRAAEALSVDRRSLYRLIERHKIERPAELPEEKRRSCVGCGKLAPEGDPPAEPGFVWACSPECVRKPNVPAVAGAG